MAKSFHELRERLLRAGVAPRHVRRYLTELADHLADLRAEEEGAGRSRVDAESAAMLRLGTMDDLAKAMIEQRQFQSWSVRAPWAIFGLAPLVILAAAYCVALSILWSGWKIFLPGAGMPFVPIGGFAGYYFGVGRLLYFSAPILVGWGIGLIAARQRLKVVWPAAGLILTAWIGGMARVRASPPAVPSGVGHVGIYFAAGPSFHGIPFGIDPLVILSVTVLPYLLWRWQKGRSLFA